MNHQLVFIKSKYICILYNINQCLTLGIKLITMKIVNMITHFLNLVYFFLIFTYLFLSSPKAIFSLLLERQEGRRETHPCGTETLIDCIPCTWTEDLTHPEEGWNPEPGHVPWLGIEPTTFLSQDKAPTNWATRARGLI